MVEASRAYLDYNATAPLRAEAASALVEALGACGNASSVHAEGRAARGRIEAAREAVAALVGADPKGVTFTSGGSEANALALSPGFHRLGEPAPEVLLVSAGEHPCVLEGHRFPDGAVAVLPLDSRGVVDLDALAARLAAIAPRRALVSIQAANNETGVIQPIAEAAAIARAHGATIHCDAVQAPGRMALDMAALGLDALSLSAHKIGGPQGVGALVLADDSIRLDRLVRGGGQERGRRAGTEPVAAISGFGAAARALLAQGEGEIARILGLRDRVAAAIRNHAPQAFVFGDGAARLPNTVAFAVPGLRAEIALIDFDLKGVALSSGSACSSGKVKASHVLAAMGVEPALAACALRASLGHASTEADVIRFASALEDLMRRRDRGARAA